MNEINRILEMVDFYGHQAKRIPPLSRYWKHFGWTVPEEETLTKIAEFLKGEKVLEYGAGLGLWSKLLQLKGIDLDPVDEMKQDYVNFKYMSFTNIIKANAKDYIKKKDYTALLFIYPDTSGDDYETLKLFKGTKIVLIGLHFKEDFEEEDSVSPIGSKNFYNYLYKNFNKINEIKIKTPGTMDYGEKAYFFIIL